jgi:DNA-binding MarR family transcriptional regulator
MSGFRGQTRRQCIQCVIFYCVPTRPSAAFVAAVAEMIEAETDLMWRFLRSKHKHLTPAVTLVLNRLNHEGPMRLTALASAEDTSQPAMTQLVQRMEQQGLLKRLSDPDDGRAALVALSDSGREIYDRRTENHRSRLAQLLAELPAEDRQTLWLAARVAAPIVRRLTEIAEARPQNFD